MTDLRAAAQALLDAIDAALPYAPHRGEFDRVADSADDLRDALAQQAEPVQEPFALPCPTPKACREHCCSGHCIPRATSPQQTERDALRSLINNVLRCRYPVCTTICSSGYGWDIPRLNEVIDAAKGGCND